MPVAECHGALFPASGDEPRHAVGVNEPQSCARKSVAMHFHAIQESQMRSTFAEPVFMLLNYGEDSR